MEPFSWRSVSFTLYLVVNALQGCQVIVYANGVALMVQEDFPDTVFELTLMHL